MTLRPPFGNDAKTYGFEWLRYMLEAGLQEGVIKTPDLKVTAAAAGGMRVDIAAGAALVKGDSGVAALGITQGLFPVINDADVANAATLAASDGTNPRIDQIGLRVRDSSDLATGADDATFVVATGAPTAGATLDNRLGAGTVGNDVLRLADVLVPAGSSAVVAGNVRDRRPWARGAMTGASTFTTLTQADYGVGTAYLEQRVELGGNPVEVRYQQVGSYVLLPAGPTYNVFAGIALDGAVASGGGAYECQRAKDATTTDQQQAPLALVAIFTPGAGSHKIGAWLRTDNNAVASSVLGGHAITVRELVGAAGPNLRANT